MDKQETSNTIRHGGRKFIFSFLPYMRFTIQNQKVKRTCFSLVGHYKSMKLVD